MQAVVYKSANKVSDEKLITDLPLQHTSASSQILKALPQKTLWSLWKLPDYIHPECSCLSMAIDNEFRLGAAPGNPET